MTHTELPVRRRPKDRKDRILEQAARLFIERGFPDVTMEEIADAAGITARALYRHDDSKAALLARVITDSQDRYLDARQRAGGGGGGGERTLTEALPGLVEAALATRRLTVLWQREARYLPEADRRAVRGRLNSIVAGIHDNVVAERPGLGDAHAEIRAWGVSSTLTSLGFHDLALPGDDMIDLLNRACAAAAAAPPVVDLVPVGERDAPALPASRREQILTAGGAEFARHGYTPVSTTTIARRAGIAGPGIYRYFESKQEILDSLVRRHDEWLALEHLRALRTAGGARQRIHALVEGCLRVCADAPDLVTVALVEGPHLSPALRDTVTRNRQDREQVWIDALLQVTPDLPRPRARILVRAATSFLDDAARTPRIWRHGGAATEIAATATAILGLR